VKYEPNKRQKFISLKPLSFCLLFEIRSFEKMAFTPDPSAQNLKQKSNL